MPVNSQDTAFNMGDKERLRSHSYHVYIPAPANINVNTDICQNLQSHAGMPQNVSGCAKDLWFIKPTLHAL